MPSLPSDLKARFYASVSVLYLTERFYARKVGAYGPCAHQEASGHNGEILRLLNYLALLAGVYPLPLCVKNTSHNGNILRQERSWRKIFPFMSTTQSQGEGVGCFKVCVLM